MKKLIMCEGSNELEIVNILIKNNLLLFEPDELVYLTPFAAKQLSSPQITLALNVYHGKFEILRIGDTMTDQLKILPQYRDRIIRISRYCTKPELEMLLIIADDKLAEYNKVKSHITPKAFAKANITCNRLRYNNSTKFYTEYFGSNPSLLVQSIVEYKRIKSHKQYDGYLADLLR